MDAIERLESAIIRIEEAQFECMTTSIILCEIYRIMPRGFTDSEAEYWTGRINAQRDSILRPTISFSTMGAK